MAESVVDPIQGVADAHASAQATPDAPRRGRPPAGPSGDPKLDAARARDRARKSGRAVEAAAPPAPDLFKPETCGGLVRLPFDITGAWLRSESWTLDPNEAALLAGPCADTLNAWFPDASPKWAALTAFSLALLTLVGKKYMMWSEEVRAQRAKEAGE